jgi:type IV pilus assembly protein PilO
MANKFEELVEKVVKVPLSQKLAAVAGAALLLTGGVWYFLVDAKQTKIEHQKTELREVEDDLIKKQLIANNLPQFKREKEILERKLTRALQELPNESNVDDLIRSLYEVATKANVTVLSIAPGTEAKAEGKNAFYAKVPINMSVTGNYHEVAVFFDAVSQLKRIVNINNIRLHSPNLKNEKTIVKAEYVATTFRYIQPQESRKKAAQ